MSLSNTALLMIDVQSSFPVRDYWVESLAAAEPTRPIKRGEGQSNTRCADTA
ncbi:hypothetical protein [Vreelandella nanhaiensis]|uniref:hypothetical protein n=1 Tax=Vreelandella nanhaiensis TaxID=1258546 RepID=UPI001FE80874|nr:hypothetical protein [Halomonas nanhaiensis]